MGRRQAVQGSQQRKNGRGQRPCGADAWKRYLQTAPFSGTCKADPGRKTSCGLIPLGQLGIP